MSNEREKRGLVGFIYSNSCEALVVAGTSILIFRVSFFVLSVRENVTMLRKRIILISASRSTYLAIVNHKTI